MMRVLGLLLGLGLLALSSAAGPGQEKEASKAKEDPKLEAAWKQLQGRWREVGGVYMGQYAEFRGPETDYVVTREGVTVYQDGKRVRQNAGIRYVIDPNHNPPRLDIITVRGGHTEVLKTVYVIRGNTLRYVYYRVGGPGRGLRPDSLETPPDDPRQIEAMEFKRVKDDPKK